MRIISGIKKGCKLIEFAGSDIRPTTDRVKEAVFNLIQEYIRGALVLDIFAGSGALCFEAISRGAAEGVCVDADVRSVAVIENNRKKLGFEERVSICNIAAESFLQTNKKKFDIVFMDPPYNKGYIAPILGLISSHSVLADDGIIVVESDSTDKLPDTDEFCVLKQRRYGRTVVTVFKVNNLHGGNYENGNLSGEL